MARTVKAAKSVESPQASKDSLPLDRTLPEQRNPLLVESTTPPYDELVSRRRLGITYLNVKDSQKNTTNATKEENLGVIEYAYLGAPLPENLEGSEIFKPVANNPTPAEYFMMRRSRDGYVSATGMFKVAFPWAKELEEFAEREYLRTLSTTSADEQAGNLWINELAALELADEYGIRQWIVALLDPAHPTTEPHKQTSKGISAPPKFEFKAGGNGKVATPDLPPPATPGSKGSKRGKRSKSPSKLPKAASPRKRLTKAAKEAGANAAKAASASLQTALDTAASVADSESVAETEGESFMNGIGSTPNGDVTMAGSADDKVTVHVESTVETNGDIETTHTNVKVQMPADSPELPLPETTEEMIATAKKMVEEARKLETEGSAPAKSGKGKRKADEALEDDDDEVAVEAAEGRELQPAKRAKLMEQEARTQKVRHRALMGVAATLTIGAIIPYFLGA